MPPVALEDSRSNPLVDKPVVAGRRVAEDKHCEPGIGSADTRVGARSVAELELVLASSGRLPRPLEPGPGPDTGRTAHCQYQLTDQSS
jgi:hypothetical protein